jgi:hypothetical protein
MLRTLPFGTKLRSMTLCSWTAQIKLGKSPYRYDFDRLLIHNIAKQGKFDLVTLGEIEH